MKFINKNSVMGFIIGAIISPLIIFLSFYLYLTNQIDKNQIINYPPPELPTEKKISLNWNLNRLDNSIINLEEEFKGNIVFLNFWATWCRPCVSEMPSIEKLYQKFKGKIDFAIISKEPLDTIAKFRNKNHYSFPMYQIKEINPAEFRTKSIPATFIISKNRKIAVKHLGGANWGHVSVFDYIENLLKK